jgi:hypothetical protein
MGRRVIALLKEPPAAEAPASVNELVYLNTQLTLEEAAAEAAASLKTLQRAYVRGHLKIMPFGARGKRIRRRDLLAWLDAGAPTEKREPE